MATEETKRTYRISLSRDPAISGYGGFDEWEVGPLTSQQADLLIERIEKAIFGTAKFFKVRGEYTGVN